MVITMAERADVSPLRHESKHQISLAEDLVLSGRLKKLFAHDRHAGEDGSYRVTSLYFDTPYDTALRKKLDGVDRREKFRLRYYGRETGKIWLEKKFKCNELCGKRSALLSPKEVRDLLQGSYGFLLQRQEGLLKEFYSKLQGQCLRPKTIVRYDREAFSYFPGNVRITLDRQIVSGLGGLEFLNPEALYVSVLEGCTVLEVKYDAFLPDLVRLAVQIPDRTASSCSKYVLCRRYD